MDLRRIFLGDEGKKIEREARREEVFRQRLNASVTRFKRRGAVLLAAGDIAALRDLFVNSAVEPAMDEVGREWDVFERMELALGELLGEYDVELKSKYFDNL